MLIIFSLPNLRDMNNLQALIAFLQFKKKLTLNIFKYVVLFNI